MNDATAGGPTPLLPSYGEELRAAQRHAVRITCVVASPLLLAFAALDAVVVPDAFGLLLVLRLSAAVVFAGLAVLLARTRLPPMVALFAVVGLVMVPIEVGILRSGGVTSPYVYAAMLPMAGVPLLVPLTPRQAAFVSLLVIAAVYGPILVWAPTGSGTAWATGASFLACMSVLTVLGAAVHQRVLRREYEARHRVARQLGLANLGMLAGGLAHEIANPLSNVSMAVERLRSDPAVSAQAGENLARLERGVGRMTDVLEAMRAGTRTVGGRRGPVDLAAELDQALVLLEERTRGRIDVRREYASVPAIRAERASIGQVFVNLILNAVQAIEDRPEPRIVVLRVRREGAQVEIEVEDNGPGVPEDHRERIFQPLFTTKEDAGTGIGLWLGAEIARAHGGSLTVHEGAAGGALFRLTIPVDEA